MPAAMLTVPRLARLLRQIRPDILHTLIPVCNVLGPVAGKLARVPHIVCTKLALGVYRDSSRFLPIMEDFCDRFFDLVHCKSQGILDDIAAREPIPRSRMRVIYNGLDTSRYERSGTRPNREEFGIPDDAFVIGMVANLIPYKGHAEVVTAARTILDAFPTARFLFVGHDNGIQAQLESQAESLGVRGAITFTGVRRDIPNLMAQMNLLVSASHQEGFSNVLLEAMASGLPIVATRVGGNPEAVENGVTGLIVEPHAPDQLASAILSIMREPGKAAAMGERGRERVKRLFSYEAMINGMKRFYAETLAISSSKDSPLPGSPT